jgi:hypothetical protein
MFPSVDFFPSLFGIRILKNVPFYGSFGGGNKSDWQAPLLYNGREKPSTQREGPPKRSLQNVPLCGLFFHYLKLGFLLCSPIELNKSIIWQHPYDCIANELDIFIQASCHINPTDAPVFAIPLNFFTTNRGSNLRNTLNTTCKKYISFNYSSHCLHKNNAHPLDDFTKVQ